MTAKHMKTVRTLDGGTLHATALPADQFVALAVQHRRARVVLQVDRGASAVLIGSLIAAHGAAFGVAYVPAPPPVAPATTGGTSEPAGVGQASAPRRRDDGVRAPGVPRGRTAP